MASVPFDPLALKAGDLRHQITITQPADGSDASGAIVTYSDYATTRAMLQPVRGTDVLKSGQDVSQVYITVTMRYQPGITAAMRISANNGTYKIQAVENLLERNRVLRLTCLAIGANE